MPDGTAKLPGVPFTPLLSFLVDGKNLEGRERAGRHAPGCSPQAAPGLQGRGPHSHAAAAPPPPRPSSSPWCPCGPGAGRTGGGHLCKERGRSLGKAGERAGQSRDANLPSREGARLWPPRPSHPQLPTPCLFPRGAHTNYGERNSASVKNTGLHQKGTGEGHMGTLCVILATILKTQNCSNIKTLV